MNRNKRTILFICLLLTAAALQSVSAYGYRSSRIGFGVGTPNAVFIYQPAPFDLRGGYDFTEGSQFLFLSADWRPAGHIHINGPFHFYFGIGAYAKLYPEAEAENLFEGGTRLPVGLSLLFFENVVELFVEIAPGFDLYPKPAFSADPVQVWAGLTFAMQ